MIANGHVRGELQISYRGPIERGEMGERSEVAGDVSRDGRKRKSSDFEFVHRFEMKTGERERR